MKDQRVAHLSTLQISAKELDALPEYSCSIPTGVVLGKRWKRNLNAFNPTRGKESPLWIVGEYVAHEEGLAVLFRVADTSPVSHELLVLSELSGWLTKDPEHHRFTLQASITKGFFLARAEVGDHGHGDCVAFGKAGTAIETIEDMLNDLKSKKT